MNNGIYTAVCKQHSQKGETDRDADDRRDRISGEVLDKGGTAR